MSELTDFEVGEPRAIAAEDALQAPEQGTCKVCGNPVLEKTPTGRWKRKCATCEASGAPSTSRSRGGRRTPKVDIREGMENLYTALGMLALARDQELGVLIIGEKKLRQMMAESSDGDTPGIAEMAADGWADLAAHNESVNALLTKTLVGGDWAKVANAHFPLLALAFKRNPPKLGFIKRFILRRRMNGPRGNGQPPGSNTPPGGPDW